MSITLFGIDANDPKGLMRSAAKCISQDVLIFNEVRLITERHFYGREGYSRFCIKDMHRYIETDHVLIIHADSWIVNANAWDDSWLQYDYIGAAWPDGVIGNGGFSLRSKRLLDALTGIYLDPLNNDYHPEDAIICRKLRMTLVKMGVKFAPVEVCNKFSVENGVYNNQFGFHGLNVSNLP